MKLEEWQISWYRRDPRGLRVAYPDIFGRVKAYLKTVEYEGSAR